MGGGKVDPKWIMYMLATYNLLTAFYTSCVSDTLPSPHPTGGTCQRHVNYTRHKASNIHPIYRNGGTMGVAGLDHIYTYTHTHEYTCDICIHRHVPSYPDFGS